MAIRQPFVLRDRAVVALAASAFLGARLGGGPGVLAGAAVLLGGLAARRPALLCVAVAVLAGGLADRALAGLDPVAAAPLDGWVQLVSDPAPIDGGGVRVDVQVDGRRLEASAFGGAGAALEDRLAGEQVRVSGSVRPPPAYAPWLVARRVVGRLGIDEVLDTAPGSPATRLANALRRTFAGGATHLPQTSRSLLGGVVLGDDREQPPELVDDFRAAGLSHISVVSGQNVAYLLVAAGPLLRRLRWRARLPTTFVLLAAFAVVVRFEPSVLRAVAMAAVATTAAATGRPTVGLRVLAIAVTGLVLVDPLLARSVGFSLSVCASASILGLAPRLRSAIGGPRWLVEPLAVTLAAQIGTAPLLLGTFGPLPVASIPANLLAVPVAGLLMVWGLTAGIVAGVVPAAAAVLHLPTQAMTWWLARVASWGAGLPLGAIDSTRALVLVAVVAAAVLARRWWPAGDPVDGRRPLLLAAAAVVVLSAAWARPSVGAGPTPIAAVGTLWSSDGQRVLVLAGSGSASRNLEALRRVGARCVDVVAVEQDTPSVVALTNAILRRCPDAVAVAAAGDARPGWTALPAGARLPGG